MWQKVRELKAKEPTEMLASRNIFCQWCFWYTTGLQGRKDRPYAGWGGRSPDICWHRPEQSQEMKEWMKDKEKKEELVKGSPPNPSWGREPKRLKVADVKSSGEEEEKKKEEKGDEKKEEKRRKKADQAKGSSRDNPKEEKKRRKRKKRRGELRIALRSSKQPLRCKSGRMKRSTRIRRAISSERTKDSVPRSINKGQNKRLRTQEYKQGAKQKDSVPRSINKGSNRKLRDQEYKQGSKTKM